VQSDLREALQQLTQTLQSLNALSDYLERHRNRSYVASKRAEMMRDRAGLRRSALAVMMAAALLAGCASAPPERFYS
jgi:ferric-dicitrate binding protein FerR (iron transport regulator)